MQSKAILSNKSNLKEIPGNDAFMNFIDNLFADKKSLHVETAELIGKDFHICYCHEYLADTDPDWMDTVVPKSELVKFIVDTGRNKWDSVSVNWGVIENIPQEADAETMLLEMPADEQYYIIRDYLETLNK